MEAIGNKPLMDALTGDEKFLGTQSGVTKNATGTQIREFVEATVAATVGVASVNGETGAITLAAVDVGADPTGSAAAAQAGAETTARSLVEAHELQENPHGLTKTTIGLGSVDNTADADKPVSTAVAAELAGKLGVGPSDGVLRGVQDGQLVVIPAANGNTVVKLTQSEYDALTPDEDTVYVVIADPAPTNRLSNGDFASGATGWTAVAGSDATFSNALTVNSATNHTIAQYIADMANPPADGTSVTVNATVSGYVSGNFIVWARYTDATTDTIISEVPTSNGSKTGTITLNGAKVLERIDLRFTGAPNLTVDDVELL